MYSDWDGVKFIAFPITIKNTGQSSYNANELLLFDCTLYSSDGRESPTYLSALFDDWDDLRHSSLRPGASISGYVYIKYTGSGTYYIEFETKNGVVEIGLPV